MADREEIAYLSDIHGTTGNIAEFGANGDLRDSGKKVSDFVEQGAVQSVVQQEVDAATSEIWHAVNGVYAFGAYNSSAWAPNVIYAAGAYCIYDEDGYICVENHTSGSSFDSTKWRIVLTSAGKQIIDALLAGYSTEGAASLLNLAPQYDGSVVYEVGQMCVKDGALVVCTVRGQGATNARFSTDATVEGSIATRLELLKTELKGDIPTNVSQLANDAGYITEADIPKDVSAFENDAGYVAGGVVDSEYDTTEHGYAEGDTCTRGGKFYICIRDVAQGSEWDPADWRESTLKEVVASWSIQAHPDWDEDDPTSPAYIRNKPNIQYKVVELVSVQYDDSTKIAFQLQDRAVNIIDVEISDSRTILLLPPTAQSATVSRDFYVVFDVDSDENVSADVKHASLIDAGGEEISIFSRPGKRVTYHLTEVSDYEDTFEVSGYDSVHQKMAEIEEALDFLLAGGDSGSGEVVSNVYIPDENGQLYHRLTAETDEYGNVNIAVDNEGIPKGDFAPSVSIPDEGGLYHKLVAVTDPETGEVNIGVKQEGEER